MRKWILAGLAAALVLPAAGGIILTTLWRASQSVPEFYERALVAAPPPAEQKQAADELERKVLSLHNEARRAGRWEARFSQDHINGWLAADLPTKFPGALPVGVSEPRVELDPDMLQLAVRYRQGDVTTVLSAAGEAFLTDRPNEVAIHLHYVRAGAVPVPLGQFLEKIARRATDAGLPLRWTEVAGDPVAIVTLPLDRQEFRGRNLQVEQLKIEDGAILISGRTEPEEPRTAEKSGEAAAPPDRHTEREPDAKTTLQR
jgi:hypothetical protein